MSIAQTEAPLSTKIAGFLALEATPKLGLSAIWQLVEALSTPAYLLPTLSSQLLSSYALTAQQIRTLQADYHAQAARYLTQIKQHQYTFISYDEPHYPALLKEGITPPLWLTAQGDVRLLSAPQFAIVGARQASAYGKGCATNIASSMVQHGWVITSGLAQGVDAEAHRSALSAGGKTVAVLGHGLDFTYPQYHRQLRRDIIASQGCIVSEYWPWQPPKPYLFRQRNRIIGGLSHGVCVIEAGLKSGSMGTVYDSVKTNREVFAVPGQITNEQNWGCHALIKEGAHLVNSIDDILAELPQLEKLPASPHDIEINPTENLANCHLLDSVDISVTSIEQLLTRSKLPLDQLTAQLLTLELTGKITAVQGGYLKKQGV